jgi:hypothetical protein
MFCQLYLHSAMSSPFFLTSCCKLGFLCLYVRMVVYHVCVARRLLDGIVCKSTGLIICGAMPPVTHMPLWCAQGKLYCYIYQTVETLSQYICTCYFCDLLSPHSLGTWSVFVSPSSLYTVILKIMSVSLLCMTLFDAVLYCLPYQLLICINFIDSIIEK